MSQATTLAKGTSARGAWSYMTGRMNRWQRLVVAAVGLALLPVMFFPILPLWRIKLVAPQYREGLVMQIYVNDLRGDLRSINILNHYIGMKEIRPDSFPEFGYLPWMITVFGGIALLAALVGRRWLAFLGWLGFAAFGATMMFHFATWLTDYGSNLDPKAALKIGAFSPPLFGTNTLGNFTAHSYPSVGAVILLVAGLLGPLLVGMDWITVRKRIAQSAGMVLVLLVPGVLHAEEFKSFSAKPAVSPLQVRADAAEAGDTLRIAPGVHKGQLVLTKALVVIGEPGSVLDGEGKGTVLVVKAAGTVLSGFTVRGSGWELLVDDAGVLVDAADDVLIERLTVRDTNHGIYLRNALRTTIRDCVLEGRRGRVPEENHGNALHVWYTRDTELSGNRITGYRDGIYLSFAEAAQIEGNLAWELDRFGLHSMYSQKITIRKNAFLRNTAGVALMFSNRMVMEGNRFSENLGSRTYGLLLKDCSDSEFRENRFTDNTIGLFLDGSNRNRFENNVFAQNGWGVFVYSSSESNVLTRNAFLENDLQVALDMRRTRNRVDENGVGNYWSDARPYDLDADGQGDAPYCPVG
ncbi:MAG TPA: nitrous oxide reductase family maturation protein NosD, partial [Candidatus Eisenbacteria bacterium]|nr:nitrous oxide reductase family maturation protein NosD [Candidatus Eisenbacteria bacterium]